jgi:hypothetical protein
LALKHTCPECDSGNSEWCKKCKKHFPRSEMARRGLLKSGKPKFAAVCKRCDSRRVNTTKKRKRNARKIAQDRYGVVDVTDFDLIETPIEGDCKLQEFMEDFVAAVNGIFYERTN